MTEEQLRDVLARVVPEAPDSVADPAPVVRAARARRRAQVALAGGAVAVIAIGGIAGRPRAGRRRSRAAGGRRGVSLG